MRQTKGAITFLISAYKAILKHAYLASLATGIALIPAITPANAVSTKTISKNTTYTGKTLTQNTVISKAAALTTQKTVNLKGNVTTNSGNSNKKANLNVKTGTTNITGALYNKGRTDLAAGTKLNISKILQLYSGSQLNVNKQAVLTAKGGLTATKAILNLTGANTSTYAASLVVNNSKKAGLASGSVLNAKYAKINVASASGKTLYITDTSSLKLNSSTLTGAVAVSSGKSISYKGANIHAVAGTSTITSNAKLNSLGTLYVNGTNYNTSTKKYTYANAVLNIKGSLVADRATIKVNGANSSYTSTLNVTGNTTLSNKSSLTVEGGKGAVLNSSGTLTLNSSSTVTVGSKGSLKSQNISINYGTVLKSKKDSLINVSGTLKNNGELILEGSVLLNNFSSINSISLSNCKSFTVSGTSNIIEGSLLLENSKFSTKHLIQKLAFISMYNSTLDVSGNATLSHSTDLHNGSMFTAQNITNTGNLIVYSGNKLLASDTLNNKKFIYNYGKIKTKNFISSGWTYLSNLSETTVEDTLTVNNNYFNVDNSKLKTNKLHIFSGSFGLNKSSLSILESAYVGGSFVLNSDNFLSAKDMTFDGSFISLYGNNIKISGNLISNGSLSIVCSDVPSNYGSFEAYNFTANGSSEITNCLLCNVKNKTTLNGSIFELNNSIFNSHSFDHKAGRLKLVGSKLNVNEYIQSSGNTFLKNGSIIDTPDNGKIEINKGSLSIGDNSTVGSLELIKSADGKTVTGAKGTLVTIGENGTLEFAGSKATLNAKRLTNNGTISVINSDFTINAYEVDGANADAVSDLGGRVYIYNSNTEVGYYADKKGSVLYIDPSYLKLSSLSSYGVNGSIFLGDGSVIEAGSFSNLRALTQKAGFNTYDKADNFILDNGRAELALAEGIVLNDSAKLIVDAKVTEEGEGSKGSSLSSGSAYFDKDSMLAVDGSLYMNKDTAIKGSAGVFKADKGAKLALTNVKALRSYKIAEGFDRYEVEGFSFNDVHFSSNLLNGSTAVTERGVTVNTAVKSEGELKALFAGTQAVNTLSETAVNLDTDSALGSLRLLSRLTDSAYYEDTQRAGRVLNSISSLAEHYGVQSTSVNISRNVLNILDSRADRSVSGNTVNGEDISIFAQSMYEQSSMHDMTENNSGRLKGNYFGLIIGADKNITDSFILGLSANTGKGRLKNRSEEVDGRNSYSFYGLDLYGSYKAGSFTLKGSLGYTHGSHDLDGSINSLDAVSSKVKTDSINAQLKAQYRFDFDSVNVTPYAALRYMNLKTGGYDTEYSHNSSSEQNIFEVPLGVKLGGSFNLSDGYILNTELDVHAVKVLKGRDSKSTVTFNGYSMSDSITSRVLDKNYYGAGINLGIKKDNLDVMISAGVDGSSHDMERSASLNVHYAF